MSILRNLEKVIIGKDEVLEKVMVCVATETELLAMQEKVEQVYAADEILQYISLT